jgi:hypothetical protein
LPETRLHIEIHGFAFMKFAKPVDELNMQAFLTLQQACSRAKKNKHRARNLQYLTRPVCVIAYGQNKV